MKASLAFRGHDGSVMCVAVSPDGRRVVTGGTDCSARVWDAETGEERLVLRANREPIDAVAFSPDGGRVATTSLDRTVKLWDVTSGAKAALSGAATEVRLESGYLPLPIRLKRDPANREIRSLRVVGKVPPAGDGEGGIWLDPRPADLNPFGDVQRRIGPDPAPIRVELRYLATGTNRTADEPFRDSGASAGFRSYELVLPGGALSGCLRLVLGTAHLGPHRLLVSGSLGSEERLQQEGPVYRVRPGSDIPELVPPPARRPQPAPSHILPLQGDPPIASPLPDAPLGGTIDLSGYYTGSDGRIRRLGVKGTPGGAGGLVLDPNFITFDYFGEPMMSTAIGCQPHEITLNPAKDADPLGHGRRLYWAVSKDPKNTNRVAVVLARTEVGPHRVLLYRGDQVGFIVPAFLADRRRQEIDTAEFAGLSAGEQQAIAGLRRAIGHDLTDASVPILTGMTELQELALSGHGFTDAGLGGLAELTKLRSLRLFETAVTTNGVAALKARLPQLEIGAWGRDAHD
jgi:WD40 repeat protein